MKYRYFIKRRPEVEAAFDKYFKKFDWKAKGIVRKRFENVYRPKLLRYPYKPSDLRSKLQDFKAAVKALEEVSGKIPELKMIVQDQ